jgi:energy-coupling factor transport system permease protein
MRVGFFTAQKLDSPIHNLSGFTKLICFLILTGAVMYSYDLRVILCVMVFSFIILKISKIKFSQIKLMVIYVVIFLAVNAVLTFLFSPGYGTEIYGTRHVWLKLFGRYDITAETVFFIVTKFMKYSSVIPLGMIFLLTTDPSELASSLNAVGVHYKIAFSFSLTLRYFPDIQRDYRDISQAQQARGLEMSRKAKMWDRFKRALAILLPLILSTLDRIETITNAMDLRGFGKHKKRTWYSRKKMAKGDFIALAVSIVILAATLSVAFFINGGRFYNPFI